MLKRALIPIIISIAIFLAAATLAHAQPITGKVIGIADGDTITVLQNDRTQYKIRLYGIDCPESHQDFGSRAKQFVSDLISKKDVTVIQKGMDRKRVVGIIYLGAICVNEEASRETRRFFPVQRKR
jgi:micrococcal nuclease